MVSINNINTVAISLGSLLKTEATTEETTAEATEESAITETTQDTEATVSDDTLTTSYMPKSYTKFDFTKKFSEFRQKLMDMFKPQTKITEPEPEEPEEEQPITPEIGSENPRRYYCCYSIPEIY